jgi:hypothetical protein
MCETPMKYVHVTCVVVSYLEEGAETAIIAAFIHCAFKTSKHSLARV